MDPSLEESRLFEGYVSLGSRPMTDEEREEAASLLQDATMRRNAARAGCVLCPLVIAVLFPLGLTVLPLPVPLFGIIGLLGLGLWLIPVQKGSALAVAHGQRELAEGTVERFKTEGGTTEVLPASGRVLGFGGPVYGEVRTVGLPPALLGGEGGDRRLSEAERGEIERLIDFARRPWGISDLLAAPWLVPLGMVAYVGTLEFNPVLYVLDALASLPTILVFHLRLTQSRLRRSLRRALEADALVETQEDEARLGVLMPDGLVWTVDGQPSPLRTRWRP